VSAQSGGAEAMPHHFTPAAEDRATDYRNRVELCRRAAEAASRAQDKAAWLKLAEQWQTLAEQVEGDSAADAVKRSGSPQQP
jgi:hypothetical protein